jgi:hypothetical protein
MVLYRDASPNRRQMRPSRERTSLALLAFVIVVALSVGAVAYNALSGAGTATQTTRTPSAPLQLVNSTTGAAAGVQLSLVLNATKLVQGGAINATAYVTNTLAAHLNLTFGALAPDPIFYEDAQTCASSTPVVVIEVSEGYFVAANLTDATPLQTWHPLTPGSTPSCSDLSFAIYPFLPQSDELNGTILAKENGVYPDRPVPASTSILSAIYYATDYASGQQVATVFPPGIYTVSASDAWGQLEILHFEVTPG